MLETVRKFRRDVGRVRDEGPPKVMFWAIINHCNAVCTSCSFYLVPRAEKTHCDLAEAKRAIATLARSNFRLVSLTGGEPLMHPQFFDICDEINRQGIEVSYVPTNGLLIDDETARRLKSVRAKVVGLSIEPIEANGMGATRKIRDFRNVLARAIAALNRHGVSTYGGILLSKATRDIHKTMQFAQELGFTKVSFSYPQLEQRSTYIASRRIPEIDLTAEEIEEMVSAIKAAKRDFPKVAIYNTDESLDDLARFYRGEPRRFPCWGGKKLFYMDWKLDLYPCFTLGRKYGNLLEMERIEVEEEGLCDLCTQQAFRDFGPLFAGISAVSDALVQIGRAHPLLAARRVMEPDARAGMHSLLEVYRGGFV
ncbi:MAG TPA: radical SAM protein [Solirubrobacterales bacterium]|jgi:MoaA/NifB/PqqE/SkfB family radical SAM enzyme